MITGASHSLHANLTDSLSYYRQLLDAQKAKQASTTADGEASQLPSPVPPTEPKPIEVVTEPYQIPLSEQLKQAEQERRDTARAAAVAVDSMQHQQDLINTYINVSNSASDDSVSSDNAVTPAVFYQETLQYQRRQDLLAALDQAADGDQLGGIINITI